MLTLIELQCLLNLCWQMEDRLKRDALRALYVGDRQKMRGIVDDALRRVRMNRQQVLAEMRRIAE